jgi:hypothetical protein
MGDHGDGERRLILTKICGRNNDAVEFFCVPNAVGRTVPPNINVLANAIGAFLPNPESPAFHLRLRHGPIRSSVF